MMNITRKRALLMSGSRRPGSSHLEGDALDNVQHVLAAIGDRLHRLVELLPLDDLDSVGDTLEESGELVTEQTVGLVLEPIHLDGVLCDRPGTACAGIAPRGPSPRPSSR